MRVAADVGQQAGQRPPQRDHSEPSAVSQRGVGDPAGRLDVARAAQRGGQHDLRFDGVSRRTRSAPARRPVRRGRPPSRRLRLPSPVRPTPRRAAPAPRRHRSGDELAGTRKCRADAANRPMPSASAASPMSASAPAAGVGPGQCQRPAVPCRGPGRASRADAGTTPGCCGPAKPTGAAPAARPGADRRARCRNGPDRLRRPRAATVRAVSSRRAAASVGVVAERGVRRSTMFIGWRRYQASRKTRYRRARLNMIAEFTLVNS